MPADSSPVDSLIAMEPVDDFVTPAVADSPVLAGPESIAVDLDGIERDLADVEIALARLEAGTYWTCEETGQKLSDELMESNPTARHIATS